MDFLTELQPAGSSSVSVEQPISPTLGTGLFIFCMRIYTEISGSFPLFSILSCLCDPSHYNFQEIAPVIVITSNLKSIVI